MTPGSPDKDRASEQQESQAQARQSPPSWHEPEQREIRQTPAAPPPSPKSDASPLMQTQMQNMRQGLRVLNAKQPLEDEARWSLLTPKKHQSNRRAHKNGTPPGPRRSERLKNKTPKSYKGM